MSSRTANLVEIIQLGSEIAGVFDLPADVWPLPGQYLPCQSLSGDLEILVSHLFRVFGDPDQCCLGPIPETWQPGEQIACSSPQGHGFSLPKSVWQLGLVPFQVSSTRLLTLVRIALEQNAAVSLFYSSTLPADLLNRVPSLVEILPLSSMLENPDWPDFLAVDLERSSLAQFSALIDPQGWRCAGQVLVRTAMPCRGLGECGLCAVQTKHGWGYACVDGPVFDLEEVWHVA